LYLDNDYHSEDMSSLGQNSSKLRFADLFAGVGGFHMALDGYADCVFASEMDERARETYFHVFSRRSEKLFGTELFTSSLPYRKDLEIPFFNRDITTINLQNNPQSVPDFDILCAGFPCQPFSNAGLRQGFEDEKNRGNLFENIVHFLIHKKPRSFFLENVRGLRSHKSDSGHTLDIIREKIDFAGYDMHIFDVKASDYGLPQHRPRLFLIGFLKGTGDLEYFLANQPDKKDALDYTIGDVLGAKEQVDAGRLVGYTLRVGGRGSGIGDPYNWDQYLVDGKVITLNSDQGIRLMGFKPYFDFPKNLSESARMKQLGNSVAVPAIEAYGKAIVQTLKR
jgi:DNA (cytosine-5)-methyltransferase 1